MKKTEIMKIIKSENKNDGIKWEVVENTKMHIVVKNDYDSSIRFEVIAMRDSYGDEFIKAVDRFNETVCYMMKLNSSKLERLSDFTDLEDGKRKAIRNIVLHFYYYY